ncbi:MAG: hypothetical protein MJE68_14850 [Proteobacteria bacterium]|nr:hypothetical protein [Pseudomonadota bacterium]
MEPITREEYLKRLPEKRRKAIKKGADKLRIELEAMQAENVHKESRKAGSHRKDYDGKAVPVPVATPSK